MFHHMFARSMDYGDHPGNLRRSDVVPRDRRPGPVSRQDNPGESEESSCIMAVEKDDGPRNPGPGVESSHNSAGVVEGSGNPGGFGDAACNSDQKLKGRSLDLRSTHWISAGAETWATETYELENFREEIGSSSYRVRDCMGFALSLPYRRSAL